MSDFTFAFDFHTPSVRPFFETADICLNCRLVLPSTDPGSDPWETQQTSWTLCAACSPFSPVGCTVPSPTYMVIQCTSCQFFCQGYMADCQKPCQCPAMQCECFPLVHRVHSCITQKAFELVEYSLLLVSPGDVHVIFLTCCLLSSSMTSLASQWTVPELDLTLTVGDVFHFQL